MMQNIPIILGQYRPLDSFLHRLDARAKLLPVLLVLILSLMTDSFLFYIIIQLSLLVSLLSSGIDYKTLARNFKPILIIVLITSLYHLLFSGKDSEIIFQLSFIKLRADALYLAVFYSLRLVIFISIAFLITLTNSPSELGEALYKLLKPLKKFKVPIDDLTLILFIAIRFIPILYNEFNTIKNAQIIRGVNFSGSVFNRIKKTTSVIIPVFVSAIQRADDLALALQVRGYQSGNGRTFYSRSGFGLYEWLFTIGVTIYIAALFYFSK